METFKFNMEKIDKELTYMHDDEQLADMGKEKDPIAMYLIVRKSLNMSPGKIAAQVGHGVQMMTMQYCNKEKHLASSLEIFDKWINQSSRKIVLIAKDNQWGKIKQECKCFLVRDAGITQIEAGSETVIALWPMYKSDAPKVIKRLQVLA